MDLLERIYFSVPQTGFFFSTLIIVKDIGYFLAMEQSGSYLNNRK